MVQEHKILFNEKGFEYRVNPLYYFYNGAYYFQVQSNKAIKFFEHELMEWFLANKIDSNSLMKVLDKLGFSEDSFDFLIKNNILIPSNLFKKRVIKILDGLLKIIESSKSDIFLDTIFVISETQGLRSVNIIKSALLLEKEFKIYRPSKADMFIKFKNGYIYDINSNNVFGENLTAIRITKSKSLTSFLLRSHGIDVPYQEEINVHNFQGIRNFVMSVGYPICIKADALAESIDVFPGIVSKTEMLYVTKYMSKKYEYIIFEEHISGNLFRFYYCYGTILGVTEKKKKTIIGDGKRTIRELILEKYSNPYIKFYIEEFKLTLRRANLSMKTILDKGEQLTISSTAQDTDYELHDLKKVHINYFNLIQRVASIINLNIFAIDIISDCIQKFNKPYIIEIQENPEFGRKNKLSEAFYLEVVKHLG